MAELTSADQILFRCSSLGRLVAEPKEPANLLSDGTKKYLDELYADKQFGIKKSFSNLYMQKGNAQEDLSITLYSRIKKRFYMKNEQYFENEFCCGTPDILDEDANEEIVVDIKSSWDKETFKTVKEKKSIALGYLWQLRGYMALTNRKKAILAYCLVDTPPELIEKEKYYLGKEADSPYGSEKYYKGCDEIDRRHSLTEFSLAERVHEITIYQDNTKIDELYKRITLCRKYLNQRHFGKIYFN